jgi:hypothetical protein
MYGIFLLILILLLGLNVLTWLTQGGENIGLSHNLYAKTENFRLLNPSNVQKDYRLLADVLPMTPSTQPVRTDINSLGCNEKDDSVQLQLGGDYSQRTNNYLRIYPDSCSAPRHEFLLGMYNIPTSVVSSKPIQALVPS